MNFFLCDYIFILYDSFINMLEDFDDVDETNLFNEYGDFFGM
jgi:hypothetical protein